MPHYWLCYRHRVERARLGIIATNYMRPKIHNKFRLCLVNNKRGLRLTTIELEVSDGQVPY